ARNLQGSTLRVHNDVDVGGSYAVKRGIKHSVLVGYLSRRLGFPVRLVEGRLGEKPRGEGGAPQAQFTNGGRSCGASRTGWRTCSAQMGTARSAISISRSPSTTPA